MSNYVKIRRITKSPLCAMVKRYSSKTKKPGYKKCNGILKVSLHSSTGCWCDACDKNISWDRLDHNDVSKLGRIIEKSWPNGHCKKFATIA